MENFESFKPTIKDCTVKEFIDMIGNNVSSLNYNPVTKKWMVKYKTRLVPDEMSTNTLLRFLYNGG